jgi:hypothetical protein
MICIFSCNMSQGALRVLVARITRVPQRLICSPLVGQSPHVCAGSTP